MTTAIPVRRLRSLARPHLPRLTARRIAVLAGLALVLFGAWLWLRSSSLVAVKKVQISGLSGADVSQIRSALTGEALTMTTLNASTAKLESAVSSFPHVAGIRLQTHFPHGLTIIVNEEIPVASVVSASRTVAVDGAGLLLPKDSTAGLTTLPAAPDTGGSRVTSAGTLATLTVLASAPYQLLPHIASARFTAKHGVTLQLRNGPVLYFGNTLRLAVKWSAAKAVLASADSAGATYIDVSAPDRPAAGTGS